MPIRISASRHLRPLSSFRLFKLSLPKGGRQLLLSRSQDATQQVNLQAETLRRNARQRLYKSLAITLGNLVVAGIAAIALSRLMAGEIDFEGFVAK